MSSLPETSVWEPAELRADAVPASPAPSNPPQFEVSTSAGVPERLLRPARAAAHAAGYAAGWADGMHAAKARAEVAAEQARAELDARQAEQRVAVQRGLAGLDAAAERLERIALPGAEELESVLLEAAFGIAEALVGHALRDDEKRAPAVLARVLDLAPHHEPLTVRLHPDDHAVVADHAIVRNDARQITLVPDATLAPGDAVATSGATEIDARIRAGLHRIKDALRQ